MPRAADRVDLLGVEGCSLALLLCPDDHELGVVGGDDLLLHGPLGELAQELHHLLTGGLGAALALHLGDDALEVGGAELAELGGLGAERTIYKPLHSSPAGTWRSPESVPVSTGRIPGRRSG